VVTAAAAGVVAVIGAGAVGASTALHLARDGVEVLVLEKESGPAMHQSGRNSGVIHAGYNLKPGSMKAQYCVEGNRELRQYCGDRGVPVRDGGILVVAQSDQEMDVLRVLVDRGQANGVRVKLLAEDDIKSVEPHARGIGALHALDGASFDARSYVHALTSDAIRSGARIFFDHEVHAVIETEQGVRIQTNRGDVAVRAVVNAAGLYADVLADDLADDLRVIPFRGYYAELRPERTSLVNSHIYATPDLNFPFLGVHLSKRTDGRVIVGPGAMLAFGREAYSFGSVRGGLFGETLRWPGLYRMLRTRQFQELVRKEVRKSLSTRHIAREAMVLVPEIHERELVRSFAGNRAQLVDRQGHLVDDIVVRETARSVHVLNAVSPGLTCSLPFGRKVASTVAAKI
jgi:(S)-2-hydroxyglutarate dehydrogenase